MATASTPMNLWNQIGASTASTSASFSNARRWQGSRARCCAIAGFWVVWHSRLRVPAIVHHWVPLSRKLAPQTPGLRAAVGHAPEKGQQHAFRLSCGTGFSGAAQQGLASAAAAQGTAARSKRGLHLQAAIQGLLQPARYLSVCCEGFRDRHPESLYPHPLRRLCAARDFDTHRTKAQAFAGSTSMCCQRFRGMPQSTAVYADPAPHGNCCDKVLSPILFDIYAIGQLSKPSAPRHKHLPRSCSTSMCLGEVSKA